MGVSEDVEEEAEANIGRRLEGKDEGHGRVEEDEVPEVAKEAEHGVDEGDESELQQEDQVNDPLTQTGTGAPNVPWQTPPGEGGEASGSAASDEQGEGGQVR